LGGDHIEGRQAVRELLRAGTRRAQQVLISEDVHDTAILAEIADLCEERRVPIRQLTRRKLDDYALTESHQGVIAQAESIRPVEIETLISGSSRIPPLVIALDGVTDPGNLGAILRTAEVAGVSGIVLPRHRAVRLTPAAVKAAAGAVEHLPIALVAGLPAVLKEMSEKGLWIVGLDSNAENSIYEMRVATEPLMIVLGAEGEGLSHLTKKRCDQLVSIPQIGHLESLNVSNAAAITIYEVKRQREIGH
jgi:23S rRNA (guanosine2251-2'-O)-methyltransferase